MAVEPMTSEVKQLEDMSEEELSLEAERLAAKDAEARAARREQLRTLGESVEKKFYERAIRRKQKEMEWTTSTDLYLGNLATSARPSPDAPFSETVRSSRVLHNIVASKCDIAIAQSVDMQFAGGEKNWDLSAAVNSADPADRERVRLMEHEIEAQLEHCAYGRKCRRAMEDRVILGTGIIKGPVNTGSLHTVYAKLPGSTTWVAEPTPQNYPSIEWVNPWFFYPDDTVNDFNRAGDSVELHPKSAFDLKKLMGHPGFDAEAIGDVLETNLPQYYASQFPDYAGLVTNNPYLFADKYWVMEYHGPITKEWLDVMSVTPQYQSANDEYYGEVWVVCGRVIRLELENIEASFELPYAVSTWKKDPGSVFGFGSPLLMADAQRVAREVWRMVLDNASLSSGPQVASHSTYVEPVNGKWELAPNKAWRLLDSTVDVEKAIQFFNVPNITQQLLPVLDLARQFGEEESLTPMIAGGLQGADVSESASGQLMMRESSTTLLDFLSEDWSDNVTEKMIRRFYAWNMQYNPKDEIKGNYSVDVRTVAEYKSAQMKLRDLERLSMEAAQNPQFALMLNMDEMYRARIAGMGIPHAGIVRTPEEIGALKQQQASQPDPKMIELQMEQQKLDIEKQKLEMEKQRLAFEMHQQQQREQWENEEKMSANYARTLEAESRVISSQNEKETQFLKIAAQMEDKAQARALTERIAVMNAQTQRFGQSMANSQKARDQLLTVEELRLARETGEGI